MFKNLIYKFLRIFDIKVLRYSSSLPLDLTKKKIHPRTISNIVEKKKVILNLDFELGRTNRFFSLNQNSFDPYLFSIIYSLKNNLQNKNLYDLILKMLEIYNNKIKINNQSDFFGLNSSKNKILDGYPIWSAVLPWEDINIEYKFKNFPKSVKIDRANNGFIIETDDPQKIMKQDREFSLPSHVKQYVSLINSIRKNGYISDNEKNYIEAELLLKGDEYCWKPGGEGNHRTSVVASLGHKTIKAIVTKMVRFEELDYWPNVINGTFKKQEAEEIFNRYFEARPPDFNKDWILYCKELIDSEKNIR